MADQSNSFFMAYDGDSAGRMVGRAILANDVKGLADASARINAGHDIVEQWVSDHGGQKISAGGDEGTFTVPVDAIEDLERLRADYHFATQLTMTIGIGSTLSEAGRALMVGKTRGKDQIVRYDPSIDDEIRSTQEHVAQGTASEEEKKIGEAYLQPEQKSEDESMNSPKPDHEHTDDCQYCQQAEDKELGTDDDTVAMSELDDCQYCREADSNGDDTHDCEYCRDAESREAGDEHHCQYCAEADAKAAQAQASPDAQAQEGTQPQLPAEGSAPAPDAPITEEQLQVEDRQDDPNNVPFQGSPPMESVLDQIANDTPQNVTSPDQVASQIDTTDMAVGTAMDDNASTVEDYDTNQPGAMGLSEDDEQEQGPDLSQVLQDGLDSHSDNIQREKVINMVSEALEGFKASKHILEKAKEQAPQLYQSSIAMIKAMIEMARMLGLEEDVQAAPGEQPAQGEQQTPEEADNKVADQQAAASQNEWHDPFPKHPGLSGEEKNKDPKAVRQ